MIVLAQLALIWTHVPWHDELQAVLLARDTNTLTQWYTNFRYEGHPPLWHFLLKLMLVFFNEHTALRAATSLVALATAWLIYRKSPFGPWTKLALGLNYFILFEYAVIARGYCLGVAFIFAAIAWRAHPISWFFAALIPQAGANAIFFPGIFAAIMLGEKRWSWFGATLCGLGVVVAAVWMAPAPDVETIGTLVRKYLPLADRFGRTVLAAGNIVFPLTLDGGLAGWTNTPIFSLGLSILIGAQIPLLVYVITRSHPLTAAAAAMFIFLTFALSTFGVELSLRHFGFIVIMVIACQWVDVEKGRPLNPLAGLWFAILAFSGLGAAIDATRGPFSPSLMTADHIARTTEPDRLLIPVNTLLGAEITAFTGRPTFNVTNQCLQTFVQWKGPVFRIRKEDEFPIDGKIMAEKRKALEIMKAAAARAGGKALLILDENAEESFHWIADDPALSYDRYISIGGLRITMDRHLYRLDVPPDPNPAPIPPCVP
jgi:hypothetical protein